MNPWEQIVPSALALKAEHRDAFLTEACAGDEDLRRHVRSLLAGTGSISARADQTAWAASEEVAPTPPGLTPGTRLGPYIACVYSALGNTNKAMEWLERTDTGFACWPFFRIDPHLANLRELPQFQSLVADLERKYTALKIKRL